jgi:hypothetical protein
MTQTDQGFTPGLRLNCRFFWEVVKPIADAFLGPVRYSAALIGYGSDVLGYDTARSTDHNWGPRLQIFLSKENHATLRHEFDQCLRNALPHTFAGYSVNYTEPDLDDNGTQQMRFRALGPVDHLIEVTTVEDYFREYLGVGPHDPLDALEWLALPEQKLLEVTAGEVFWDALGTLNAARARVAYVPRPVWLCRLAAQWSRLSEEEPFTGRCGELGDDLGSRLIAARLTRDIMRLAFLYARRYAPYSKWLGTAFAQLPLAGVLTPFLTAALAAESWQSRESAVVHALQILADEHNRLGITLFISPESGRFFGRPYTVLMSGRFAAAICAEIEDPRLLQAATIGGVDQFADCVPITSSAAAAARLRGAFAPPATPN